MCLQWQGLKFGLQIVHKMDKHLDNEKLCQQALQCTVVNTLANLLQSWIWSLSLNFQS